MPSVVERILDEVEALLTSDSPVHQVLARVRVLRAEHMAGDKPVDASGQPLDYEPETVVEPVTEQPASVDSALPRGAAGDPVRSHDADGVALDYHETPAASSPPTPNGAPEASSEQAAPPESTDASANEQAAATGGESQPAAGAATEQPVAGV